MQVFELSRFRRFVLSAAVLLVGVAACHAGDPVVRPADPRQAATIAAQATVEAAKINAAQAKENARIQAAATTEVGRNQLWASFGVVIAALITYIKLRVDDKNAKASYAQAQAKLDQDREQFESRQAAETVALERRLSEERERHIIQSTAQDRKQLSDRFVDVQDRLVGGRSGIEVVNAVYGLADVARELDPQFIYRPGGKDLANILGLPETWGPDKLLLDSSQPRPCERAHPYFRGAATRLASILHLEESQAVRDAAVRAIGQLSAHSHREIEGLRWEDFEAFGETGHALPLTAVLIGALVQANRDAWYQWVVAWGQFVAAAEAAGETDAFTEDVDNDQEIGPYPREPEKLPGEDLAAFLDRARKARKTRLLGQIWHNQDCDGRPPYPWQPHHHLWSTALMLCPFMKDPALLTDFLLDASSAAPFEKAVRSHYQAVSSMSKEDKLRERAEMRSRLDVSSQRLISTRDAIGAAIKAGSFALDQLPGAFEEVSSRPLSLEETKEFRRQIWDQVGGGLTLRTRLERRVGHDLSRTFLPGIDFGRCCSPGIILSQARLDESNLDHAWMPGANLAGAMLTGADLTFAKVPGCDAGHSRLDYSALGYSDFTGSAFDNASICEASLVKARFPGSVFYGAKLRDTGIDRDSLEWFEGLNFDLAAGCDIYENDGSVAPRIGGRAMKSKYVRDDA